MKTDQKVNDYPKLDIAKLRRVRRATGRSVAQCAREAGLPIEMWELVESGKVRKIDLIILALICEAIPCDGKAVLTEVRGEFTKITTHFFVIDSDISNDVLPMPGNRTSRRPKRRRRDTSDRRWYAAPVSLN